MTNKNSNNLLKDEKIKELLKTFAGSITQFPQKLKDACITLASNCNGLSCSTTSELAVIINEIHSLNIKFTNYSEINKLLVSIERLDSQGVKYKKFHPLLLEDIKKTFSGNQSEYESNNNYGYINILNGFSPITNKQFKVVIGEAQSGKTVTTMHLAADLLNNGRKVAVVVIDERQSECERWTNFSKDLDLYAIPFELKVSDKEKFYLVKESFKDICNQSYDVVIIDSLSRLYRLIDNVKSTVKTNRKSGGLVDEFINQLRDMITDLKEKCPNVIGTCIYNKEDKGAKAFAYEMQSISDSILVTDKYLADRKAFPAINYRMSSTRNWEKEIDPKFDKYKEFITMCEEYRAKFENDSLLVKYITGITINSKFSFKTDL